MEGQLKATNSRVSYKNLYAILKGLGEANPLTVDADVKVLS